MSSGPVPEDIVLRDPDSRVMLQVRQDKPGAFELLVDRYRHRVVAIAAHMLHDQEEAEDLAQEVFLRVFRNRHKWEPTAKFSTWLFTIVNNLALNAIRDRKRKPINNPKTVSDSGPLGARPLEQLIPDGSGAMPSRVFAKGELASVVRNAVGLLPEDQRLAVVLNKFEDMSYREIADIMGRSEMAIKSLLSRARTALRDVIEPYISGGKAVRRTDGARATGDSGAQAAAGS